MIKTDSKKLITLYQQRSVKVGKELNTVLNKSVSVFDDDYSEADVTYGFHSFKYKKDAIYHAQDEKYRHSEVLIIYKCIIPKGSEFYEGIFDYHISYASNKIIYLTPIKEIQ